MIVWVGVGAFALAFGISLLATSLSKAVAVRVGMMDIPRQHKMHVRPVPLLGGSAMFAAIVGPSLLAVAMARVWSATNMPPWLPAELAPYVRGAAMKAPEALVILAGALVLHVVGLIDDRKGLGPWLKLAAQSGVATAVVLLSDDVRILTVLGAAPSAIASILWLVVITNAFNFLDNMDGLSAGVAVICAAALLGASAGIGQVFVSAWLCVLLGALIGFLPHNFPPASTFMGDAGSLLIGYMLGVLSCLTTYVHGQEAYYAYGIFVPLVVMAVPLYDMVTVIALRIRDRRNPMVGDRRHFSHRLVRRGMSARGAVLTIWLCTAGTAISASLLPRVKDPAGAALVFLQTVAILLIIALLEACDKK